MFKALDAWSQTLDICSQSWHFSRKMERKRLDHRMVSFMFTCSTYMEFSHLMIVFDNVTWVAHSLVIEAVLSQFSIVSLLLLFEVPDLAFLS